MPRTPTKYEKNVTCARKLELEAEEIAQPALEQIGAAKDLIIWHATRRVDFFFYLLVAYYGKKCTVEIVPTTLQHGQGSTAKHTHACHSSLFPAVADDAQPDKARDVRVLRDGTAAQKKRSLLDGTFFSQTLNATVELPRAVNGVDGHFEGRKKPTQYRRDCLDIINQVATQAIDPIAGLQEFLGVTAKFFTSKQTVSYIKASEVKKKILQYEKTGMFSMTEKKGEELVVCKDYVEMMLRLKPKERQRIIENPRSQKEIYAHKMRELQEQILTTKFVL